MVVADYHHVLSPTDPAFEFNAFYAALKARGFLIYPGKLTEVESFRIGCIGQLDATVIAELLSAIQEALADMDVSLITDLSSQSGSA